MIFTSSTPSILSIGVTEFTKPLNMFKPITWHDAVAPDIIWGNSIISLSALPSTVLSGAAI